MNKRFFLAALTAVALTIGFTACDDDDIDAGKYEMKCFINVNTDGEIDEDLSFIKDTYSNALSASGDENEFTIQGMDSLDCVKKIISRCEKAEAKLKSEIWNDSYDVQVLHDKTIIYDYQYGQNGDNADLGYEAVQIYTKSVCYSNGDGTESWVTETKNISTNSFVTDFSIQNNGHTDLFKNEWTQKVWHTSRKVNHSWADDLFLCWHISNYTYEQVQSMVQNDDPRLNELVGDVKVLYSGYDYHPDEFTYNGAKYEICHGGTNGEKAPIDLNYKSGGDYMYLYVSHDIKHFGRVLDAGDSRFFCSGKNYFFKDTWGARPESDELVDGIAVDANGNMSAHYEEGIDFQKGGGKYTRFQKLRVSYIPLEEFGVKLEAVDLGLSSGTKWANKNVGADDVEDYGSYFAWGETVPYGKKDASNAQNYSTTGSYDKMRFEWSTYKWCNGTSIVTKYNQDDYMTILEPEDDAATVNKGAKWRTPYKSELRELIDECDWTWTTQNGVTGYQVKSKTNGNSIFLPAAGYRSKKDLLGEEDYVYIWSANCDMDVPYRAYYMSRSTKGYSINTEQRYLGLPIRAVYVE